MTQPLKRTVIIRICPQCGGKIVKKFAWDIEECKQCGWLWNVEEELNRRKDHERKF